VNLASGCRGQVSHNAAAHAVKVAGMVERGTSWCSFTPADYFI